MDKSKIARQYVFSGFEILFDALRLFVEERLERYYYPDRWEAEVFAKFHDWENDMVDGKITWDQSMLLKVIRDFWRDIFGTVLSPYRIEHSSIKELIDVRNKLSHNKPFSCDYAENALGLMLYLAKATGADRMAKATGADRMAKATGADKIPTTQLRAMRKALPCILGSDFEGFPFRDVDFSHPAGKKVLKLAMDKLSERYGNELRTLGIDPRCSGKDDPQIHDDGGPAWNVFVFEEAPEWRKNPHLTLGIGHEYVSAMVTLPHKAERVLDRLKDIDEERLRSMVKRVRENMRLDSVLRECDGMEPRLRVRQRPAHSVRRPLMAAHIDVDLCTLDDDGMDQPQWIDAVLYALIDKKKSNPELQIGARFPYQTCPKIAKPGSLEFVVRAWIACKPYIDLLFECKNASAA